MLLSTLGVIAGLALLTVSADWFVHGAVRIAARLRLSTVVIGAVVIGFGTSAPEMVVSGLAAGRGQLDIAVGNVIGSNVANLSLVLGAAALVTTIRVASTTVRREVPLAIGATVGYALLVQGGFTRIEGLLLLAALAAVLWWIVVSSRGEDLELTDEIDEYLTDAPIDTGREVARTLAGLVGTLVAAQVLVVSATSIARGLGLAEGFVGLTIVAVGTSLPELATSLQAARKDETDLIVGNLLGSNVFNSLGVAGIAALVGPGNVSDPGLTSLAVLLMLVVTFLGGLAMWTGHRVVRYEGGLLLVIWLGMLPLLA